MNHWPRVREIFEGAVALPTTDRPTYVAAACGDDASLHDQVDRLLEAHLRASSFLETPATVQLGAFEPSRKLEGLRVGSYLVSARIGSGGMGEVYLASDERLQRPVALKCLPAMQSHETGRVRRFLQEARAASALNHPNIVTIYEIMETAEGRFIAMELVEGQTLREIVGQRPAASDVLNVGRQCAEALRVAHAAGIIHRDIKPENIMVRSDGYIKLLDFGLARLVPASPMIADASTVSSMTAGRVIGTWRYMSPEQSRGEELTAATDIFSLGLVLYELATGQHPFGGESPASIWRAVPSYSPTPPSRVNPDMPGALGDVILDLLEKDPRLRPTSEAVARTLAGMLLIAREAASVSVPSSRSARNIVGRESERVAFRTAYESLGAGRGTMISISGEPGSGKTTLIEDFLATLEGDHDRCRIARGRCSERLAGTEVYLPWLEALDSLLQGAERDRTLDLIRTLAPTWSAHVAPATDSGSASRGEMGGAAPERLKRELAVLLRELSATQRLVLFFDDLHWADVSTVDLLSFVADRLDGFQLLLVVASRPSDLLLTRHPFVPVKQGLQARGICRELTLHGLRAADVERYLAVEFPEHRFPHEFGARIHAKTEGSPLFMSDLVRYLRHQGFIAEDEGRWALMQPLDALDQGLPESVRSMIEIKIAQLHQADRELLAAASVQGNEFDSAVIAQALSLRAVDVEERLDVLERVHAFVTRVEERKFPDHTLTSRYRFIHVLYQNALYASLQPTRKAQLAAALGHALESHWGARATDVANELAILFETAREYSRAADYYRLAAIHAGELLASREQEALARRGLAVVDQLPPSPDRLSKELSLRLALGNALIATSGYAAPEVESTFVRAGELCRQLGETPRLLPVYYGLSAFHLVKGQARHGLALGREFLDVAERHHEPVAIVGHRLLGIMSFCLGEPVAAREHLTLASAMYDRTLHRSFTSLYGGEPEMSARSYLGLTLWLLGYPDQALASHQKALGLGREVLHAHSRAHTLAFAAAQYQCRHEWRRVNTLIEEMLALTADQGLRLWHAYGSAMRGWVLAAQGDIAEGSAEIRTGLDRLERSGAQHFQPYFLCLLAEAHLENGQPDAGLEILDRAHAMIEATEERFWEPEAWRLRGAMLASEPVRKTADAERHFLQAIDIARRQQARSLELRAAMSLTQLWRQQGRGAEAHGILRPIHDWFTEGLSTFDLSEASALLKQLGC